MIKIENVYKSYKANKPVLKNINLEILPGDIFAFIGHNGAGKTTLIKCITGILNFESGEITIDGVNIKKEALICKGITAYVPDNPDIYEFMTGMEYLKFILDVCHLNFEQKMTQIVEMAKTFEIFDSLGTKISEYSHGMKQKLVLISALIRDTKFLVLDEPFVGLDPKASRIVKDMMKNYCKKGNAIFFSTHVLDTAEKLCNKVAIIKSGEILRVGSMAEIKGDSSLEDAFLKDDKDE